MKVLLVSDPSANMAAAALEVQVGKHIILYNCPVYTELDIIIM